ncbi:MAG: UDP-N-acetylmuramate dehydrogenase [Bacteroidia bacterium]|nr:UDP-N-acetylmuramate dehydrogenase [Bacteroidia bacterium]MDW8134854.1 UDP-N-acetylmuramate dehydrogenase [Bacteroidia bacterium]
MCAAASGGILLREYHTFSLPVTAKALLLPTREEEVPTLARRADYIIGEGSNILPLGPMPVVLSTRDLKGYKVRAENTDGVEVEVFAGENWDAWVRLCIARGWHGLENLAGIPGSVGGAVVQNIGAYGIELAPFLVEVRGWNRRIEDWQTIPAEACEMGYRTSLFQKSAWQDQFIITRVVLRLKKRFEPVLSYPDVNQRIDSTRKQDPWCLYETVRAIRSEKLPSQGSAGSFFKNPVLSEAELASLKAKAPDVPFYPHGAGFFKVPAAWLIDRAGLKGYRVGGAQVHVRQPLVIVNTGSAIPQDIWGLAQYVQTKVYEKWGVLLEPEVRILFPIER